MGVVSFSSSAARIAVVVSTKFSTQRCASKMPLIVCFKPDKSDDAALVMAQEHILLPIETAKVKPKRRRKVKKASKTVNCGFIIEGDSCALDLDYNEAAAKLENIFKLSPASSTYDLDELESVEKEIKGRQRRRKKSKEGDEKDANTNDQFVVRNRCKKTERLSLDKRIELKRKREEKPVVSVRRKKSSSENVIKKIDRLVREYSASADLVSLDWKKMKLPPVLPSAEHTWLFKLMQPMKLLLEAKEHLQKYLGRDPTEDELALATNMNAAQVRKHLEVGHAARSKLIKHNLRLVLFVINKYFQDFANGSRFQDLCQAGVKGLITAIDRFDSRRSQLSTYSPFWIRHAITRSMTLSSFTRVSFGLESVRAEILKAKLILLFELYREPTEEEIIGKAGISPERYHEVMRASKSVASLHSRHSVTQEEFIKGITDVNGGEDDHRTQPALLRLALDDVLDSLKPKESLVIRQRYGLDGKGDRTLGEIAGNLNISREMVRKHEMKALMKLKHPTRQDYLRPYLSNVLKSSALSP